jgi:hypothetical protein
MAVGLDAAQRRFVVTLLAQLCPPRLVPSFFVNRWKTPVLKSEDVTALDPDQGALLGPDDSKLFRDERTKVKENPADAEFADFYVQIRFLTWFVLDAKARNDSRLARELLREIREIVVLGKAAGAAGSGYEPITGIEWVPGPEPHEA